MHRRTRVDYLCGSYSYTEAGVTLGVAPTSQVALSSVGFAFIVLPLKRSARKRKSLHAAWSVEIDSSRFREVRGGKATRQYNCF